MTELKKLRAKVAAKTGSDKFICHMKQAEAILGTITNQSYRESAVFKALRAEHDELKKQTRLGLWKIKVYSVLPTRCRFYTERTDLISKLVSKSITLFHTDNGEKHIIELEVALGNLSIA